jgi:FkbM family methyltransferase
MMNILVKTAQGQFVIDPVDKIVSKALLHWGQYGLDELKRVTSLISSESEVLMLGAHIGAIAVPLSRSCRALVAVEPNPYSYRLLRTNLAINCCSNVETFNVAANHRDEAIEFVVNTHNSGGSKRMPLFKDRAYFYDSPTVISVPGVRMDSLFPGRNFALVVMDIEGSEYFAMRGMPSILAATNSLIVEFLPHHLSRVAGITVDQFLEPILPHFSTLTIPSRGLIVCRDRFLDTLDSMFRIPQGDAGLIFNKAPPDSSSYG